MDFGEVERPRLSFVSTPLPLAKTRGQGFFFPKGDSQSSQGGCHVTEVVRMYAHEDLLNKIKTG